MPPLIVHAWRRRNDPDPSWRYAARAYLLAVVALAAATVSVVANLID